MIQRPKPSSSTPTIRSPTSSRPPRKRRPALVTFFLCWLVKALLTVIVYSYYTYVSSRITIPVDLVPKATISRLNAKKEQATIERTQVMTSKPLLLPSLERSAPLTTKVPKLVSQAQIPVTRTASDIRDFRFRPLHHQFNVSLELQDKASVDYIACCGLGHRLSKMADAHYLSHLLGFGLRGFWGYCEYVEVFSYLFGPQPPAELEQVHEYNQTARIPNTLPGGHRMVRNGHGECACHFAKMTLDAEFYGGLRRRFRFRDSVNEFRAKHFAKKTVFAMHLRAGNGETGDYLWKKRGIENETQWLQNFAQQIVKLVTPDVENPVLFLATDTPSFIEKLRQVLEGVMPVIHYEQERLNEGEGVLFGERAANVTESREVCLGGWENSLIDMILLSYADILIAGRPSSFVESLPMFLVLHSQDENAHHTYCEVNWLATKFQCFRDMREWCCNGTTAFAGHFRHEYTHNPPENITAELRERWNIRERSKEMTVPSSKIDLRPPFLPYDAAEYVTKAYA